MYVERKPSNLSLQEILSFPSPQAHVQPTPFAAPLLQEFPPWLPAQGAAGRCWEVQVPMGQGLQPWASPGLCRSCLWQVLAAVLCSELKQQGTRHGCSAQPACCLKTQNWFLCHGGSYLRFLLSSYDGIFSGVWPSLYCFSSSLFWGRLGCVARAEGALHFIHCSNFWCCKDRSTVETERWERRFKWN